MIAVKNTNRLNTGKNIIVASLCILLALTMVACATNTVNSTYGDGGFGIDGAGRQRDVGELQRDSDSLSLAKAFVQMDLDSRTEWDMRSFLGNEEAHMENLSVDKGFPLVRTRADILDVYQELGHSLESIIEDANDWLIIVNYNGIPAIFYVVEDRGNNNFAMVEMSTGATEGFNSGLEYFREMFPDDEVRIYFNRWFYFLSADYSTLMEVPPDAIDSEWFGEWRGDSPEMMDTDVVAEIILEAAERADLVQQGMIEPEYGRGSLSQEYSRRRQLEP